MDICANGDRPRLVGTRSATTPVQSNCFLERVAFATLAFATGAGVIVCCLS